MYYAAMYKINELASMAVQLFAALRFPFAKTDFSMRMLNLYKHIKNKITLL